MSLINDAALRYGSPAVRRIAEWLRQPQTSVPISEFKRDIARWVDEVEQHPTVIEKHGKPEAVLISFEAYQEIRKAFTPSLDALTASFDELLAGLQGRSGQAGMEAAFQTQPGKRGATELKKRFAKG